MQAGDLNRRISIQYDTTDGTVPAVWATLDTVWANRKAFKGRAFYGAAVNESETNYVYTIRFREDVTPQMRIVDGTSTNTIHVPPVDAEDKRQWLEIFAGELIQNGG